MPSGVCQVRSFPLTSLAAAACQSACVLSVMSTSLENGCALFGEGRKGFAEVGGIARLRRVAALDLEHLGQWLIDRRHPVGKVEADGLGAQCPAPSLGVSMISVST